MKPKYSVSVIGLGKLGSPMLAHFAQQGCKVFGVDTNENLCRAVITGTISWHEEGLNKLLNAHRSNYRVTVGRKAVLATNITFIVVATPSEKDGRFSTRYMEDVAKNIGTVLKEKKSWHLVVLTSTVMPGATKEILIPTLEKFSKKKCGKDFGVCYSPEFIALGSVLRDLAHPDFVLIGEADERSGKTLEKFYRGIGIKAPVRRMDPASAEITKMAINSYITMKISFANSLATICEQVPGTNIDAITHAIGSDSRIGAKYIKAGLGFGGPCFPRDNRALACLAKDVGVGDVVFAEKTDVINHMHLGRILERLKSEIKAGSSVAVLGLAYKPETQVTTDSQAVEIARALLDEGYGVMPYDPLLSAFDMSLPAGIYPATLADAVKNADAVLVTLPLVEFKQLPSLVKKGAVVYDCWRFLDPRAFGSDVRYIALGKA